jgi:hypothetical protein
LRGRRHGNRVPITAKTGGDPQHVDFGYSTHAMAGTCAASEACAIELAALRDCIERSIGLSRFSWVSTEPTSVVSPTVEFWMRQASNPREETKDRPAVD